MSRISTALSSTMLGVLVLLAGCESETITVGTHATTPPTPISFPPLEPPVDPDAEAAAEPAALVLTDVAFVEAETNRDPFRSYADSFTARPSADPVQIDIIMSDTPVDDIGLIAIISGVANPSAMLTDTAGVGHTVHRGDHVARPEVVTAGEDEGIAVTLVWRVDRIRAGEVVLSRDDPSAPDRPALTRVLALHEDDEASSGITAL